MAIIEFYVHVDNPDQIAALYDRIEIYRSPDEDGAPTPFSAITATEPTSAIIDGDNEGPWNLDGQSLTVILDGADPVPVSFSGTNPFSLETVIDRLNLVFQQFAPNLASEVPTDTYKLRLKSPIVGTQSILQLSGSAALTLGLSTNRTNGKNARPLLSINTEEYLFRDYDGETSLWYKTRYLNTITGAVSSYTDPFQPASGEALSGSLVVTGTAALADTSGNPIVGRRLIIVPVSAQVVNNGSGVFYGVLPSVNRLEAVTNKQGIATITLVKGQRVKVFLEGTTFQREFVVPTTDFDILTVASAEPDPLSIVVSPPMPIRVS